MEKGALKPYLVQDSRLERVIELAKPVYDKANLANHNFNTHIAQVVYRALLILKNDRITANPTVLIAACLLHDIGYSITFKKEGHEKAGEAISRKILKEANFNEDEANNVIEAIIDYLIPGKSNEADILFDADILNQAGYASMYPFFASLYEYKQFPDGNDEKYRLDNFLKSRIELAEVLLKNGLRTNYGKKLLGNGFNQRKDFIAKALENLSVRNDFLVTFEDLI
jgi:5'-deoxynucleotidase YfbR-like HD superfamily hydrolase